MLSTYPGMGGGHGRADPWQSCRREGGQVHVLIVGDGTSRSRAEANGAPEMGAGPDVIRDRIRRALSFFGRGHIRKSRARREMTGSFPVSPKFRSVGPS